MKVTNGERIVEVAPEVAEALKVHGYTEVVEVDDKEAVRSQLDALGIKYHPQLGIKKLKALLPKE